MTNVQIRFADALQRSRCQCWSALGLSGWIRQATLCNGISVIFHLRQCASRTTGLIVVNHPGYETYFNAYVPSHVGKIGAQSPNKPPETERYEGPTLIAWKVSLFIIAVIHQGLARLGTFALVTATKIEAFSSLVAISTA